VVQLNDGTQPVTAVHHGPTGLVRQAPF